MWRMYCHASSSSSSRTATGSTTASRVTAPRPCKGVAFRLAWSGRRLGAQALFSRLGSRHSTAINSANLQLPLWPHPPPAIQRCAAAADTNVLNAAAEHASSLPFSYTQQLVHLERVIAKLHPGKLTPGECAEIGSGLDFIEIIGIAPGSGSQGPHLLELLAAFEIARSNLLRPASYFTDFPTSPKQMSEAQQLQQYVGQLTAPVYTDTQLLQLLLCTALQALQQLSDHAVAAATGGAWAAAHDSIQLGGVHFVKVVPGLAVCPAGAAAAVHTAGEAVQRLCQSTTCPTDSRASVAAVQTCLTAFDAVLNSTVPLTGSNSSSGGGDNSEHEATGAACIQQLMLCRHLLASWLPPLVAETAAGQSDNVSNIVDNFNDNFSNISNSGGLNEDECSSAVNKATGVLVSESQVAGSPECRTVRQLLSSALGTMSVISNSTCSDAAVVAPLVLMTEDQAAVLEPLLKDAGLDSTSGSRRHQQQQQEQQGTSGRAKASNAGGSSSSSTAHTGSRSPWIPLIPNTEAAPGSQHRFADQDQIRPFPLIVQGLPGDLILHTSATLTVHEGLAGQVLLTDLVSITDQAQQLLQETQQQQQQQHEDPSHIVVPSGAPLRLLRVTSDVLQLLLRCHPNPGVRQLMYGCGLLRFLHIQEQVLAVILLLRQQLAAQHAVQDYTQIVLSGTCVGTAAAATQLLQLLEPVIYEFACAEYAEMCAAAARAARAAGRWDGSSNGIDPWDVAYVKHVLDQRITDLNWGRDIAPYFTLPGLFDRIDNLLSATCGLRLLPATATAAVAAAVTAEQQAVTSHEGLGLPDFRPWGPHVMHLVLLDSTQQQQQQQDLTDLGLVLGHVFVELVQGWGFPFCTLLQLPQHTATPQHTAHVEPEDNSLAAAAAATGAAGNCRVQPGSVLIRLPLPTVKPVVGFGQQQQQQQRASSSDSVPLALPGPAALQALLHELGHAVSYLCPYATLIQQQASCPESTQLSSNSSSSSGDDISSSNQSWLLSSRLGVAGSCLLCSPPAGVDMRELSSHMFEHWARHPLSIMALSKHDRLGVPLPQRTAVQLPQLMLSAAGPGAGSSLKLHASLLEAYADLQMHSACNTAQQQDQQGSSISESDAAGDDNLRPMISNVQGIRAVIKVRSIPAGAAATEEADELAAAGPVGGSKAAYVMAKLLAAAAWKHLGLEERPIGQHSGNRDDRLLTPDMRDSRAQRMRRGEPFVGAKLREALLGAGCFQPGHHTVMQLLGGPAVLKPWTEVRGVTEPSEAGQQRGSVHADKEYATNDSDLDAVVTGWVPNLEHPVYQDVDLL